MVPTTDFFGGEWLVVGSNFPMDRSIAELPELVGGLLELLAPHGRGRAAWHLPRQRPPGLPHLSPARCLSLIELDVLHRTRTPGAEDEADPDGFSASIWAAAPGHLRVAVDDRAGRPVVTTRLSH